MEIVLEFMKSAGPYLAFALPVLWGIFKFVAKRTQNKVDDKIASVGDEIVDYINKNPAIKYKIAQAIKK